MWEGIGTIIIVITLYILVWFLFYTMGLIAAITAVSLCALLPATVIFLSMLKRRRK